MQMNQNKSKSVRFTEDQLKNHIKKNGVASVHGIEQDHLIDIQKKINKENKVSKKKKQIIDPDLAMLIKNSKLQNEENPPKKEIKSKGVNVKNITDALSSTSFESKVSYNENGPILSLWFSGARVLTVNELFAIMQYRKYDTFKYKKMWKQLIFNAISLIPEKERPFYDAATKVTLFRRGTKLIDLDSFQTVFKYALDGLTLCHIIADDNPEIIVETKPIQQKGEHAIGIRLEKIKNWESNKDRDIYNEWFNE